MQVISVSYTLNGRMLFITSTESETRTSIHNTLHRPAIAAQSSENTAFDTWLSDCARPYGSTTDI